jgi:hypothetical protein
MQNPIIAKMMPAAHPRMNDGPGRLGESSLSKMNHLMLNWTHTNRRYTYKY